jgi:ornithine carbamoyltransferase
MSRVPVLNMQCDIYHPCQALADLMTIREKFPDGLRGRKIAVSWTYAPSYVRPISVPQSTILMMTRFGLDVTLAHPKEFKLMPEIVAQAQANAAANGTKFEMVDDMDAAFEGAHIVYPKSWGCLVTEPDRQAAVQHISKYPEWIANEKRMALAAKDSISTCIRCRPAAARKSPTGSSTARIRWSGTRPRIACTRPRPSWP